ncbi:MAG: chorismate mutase [Clostridiales bacterium]|nr:chorismate mutase [Clostridiales bacterium]
MEDLELYRQKIDSIDKEITRLFEERMDVVLKIAEYKKENNISVLHSSREDEVIEKAISNLKNKEYKDEITSILKLVMELSKNLQNKKITNNK